MYVCLLYVLRGVRVLDEEARIRSGLGVRDSLA